MKKINLLFLATTVAAITLLTSCGNSAGKRISPEEREAIRTSKMGVVSEVLNATTLITTRYKEDKRTGALTKQVADTVSVAPEVIAELEADEVTLQYGDSVVLLPQNNGEKTSFTVTGGKAGLYSFGVYENYLLLTRKKTQKASSN